MDHSETGNRASSGPRGSEPSDRQLDGSLGRPTTVVDRLREAIRTRHYSARTERAYVAWVRRYLRFHGQRHPRDLDGRQVAEFLTYLAVHQRVSASTQNQALSAILFVYRELLDIDLPWLGELVRQTPGAPPGGVDPRRSAAP